MIGILCWSIELGQVDIITEISMLLSNNVLPHNGQLEAAYQIFKYLSNYDRGGCVVFNDSEPIVEETRFKPVNWT